MINGFMKKHRVMLMIMVMAFAAAFFLGQFSNDSREFNRASEKLEKEFNQMVDNLESNPNGQLHLKDLDSFTWDTVYIFPPYTSIQEVNDALGFHWTDNEYLAPLNETEHLVVFVFKEEVVQHFVTRRVGFADNIYYKALHPENAIFKLDKYELTLTSDKRTN